MGESKREELRNAWKQEDEKDKTKDTVIQVSKEKEDIVRDTVDKRKCFLIFGMKE
ncbi:hypothetical protein E2C01_032345 [Portunus trituberculatus]|uniref:Uncharacterized protein n=1 Tax=Portunus trituberculatus TaxID=210409 RepID=A0A5B7F0U1_PORTR|nr:hypothetical protein [Portunus trituberculatus]